MPQLQKLTPRIYYYPGDETTDAPYLFYIHGDTHSLAVDAGQSRENVENFYRAIRAVGLPLPDYTVLTHWHWDHSFGLPYVQGQSIASEKNCAKLTEVSRWQWTNEAMLARLQSGEEIEFCHEMIQRVYPDLTQISVSVPQQSVAAEREIDLGGVTVRLLAVDSPHSRDALLVFVPQEQTLIVGDAHCGDFYDNHGSTDPARLQAYLKLLRSLDFQHYGMGHSEPCTKEEILKELG